MTVAVTGATGFIGRHVVAALERRGISPVLLCRTAPRDPGLRRHVAIDFDLRSPSGDRLPRVASLDTLIHLAWGGLPNYGSLHHFEDELPAHYRFLRAAAERGVRNLLVTGTCFEYGMKSGALREDLAPEPSNPYGFAKNALRAELQYLQEKIPFNLTWARVFYLFGEGQPATSLWPQLKNAVARGDKNFNMSGGAQIRDYLPVETMAEHLVALALHSQNHGIVNVCSGEPVTVRSMVERWIADNAWSISLNLGHYPYPDHEPMEFWGDREKLDRCLSQSIHLTTNA